MLSEEQKKERAEIEAQRGIVREYNNEGVGKIIRTDEWKKSRVELLTKKISDYKQRIKNAEAEIKLRQKELETK